MPCIIHRYHNNHKIPWRTPTLTTTALSSTQYNIMHNINYITPYTCGYPDPVPDPESITLPMFVSQCPGWVCYAEKTHPELIPYMSTTKSPQQILGVLIKKVFVSYILSTASSTPSSSAYSSDSNNSDNNDSNKSIPKLPDLTAIRLIDSTSTSHTVDNNSNNNNSDDASKSKSAVMLVSIQPCFDKKLEASRLVRRSRDDRDE